MIPVGEPAPELCLPDIHGTPTDLADLDGAALLVFLPAAFTPLCSGELAGMPSLAEAVAAHGVRVLAVSCDSMFVLRTWAEQSGITGDSTLTLLSDFWPHGEVSRRYQAFDDERGTSTRTSYLIDGDGVIRWSTRSPAGVARDLEDHRTAVEQHLPRFA